MSSAGQAALFQMLGVAIMVAGNVYMIRTMARVVDLLRDLIKDLIGEDK